MERSAAYPGEKACFNGDWAAGLENRRERRPAGHPTRAEQLDPVPTAQPGKKDGRRPAERNTRVKILS